MEAVLHCVIYRDFAESFYSDVRQCFEKPVAVFSNSACDP